MSLQRRSIHFLCSLACLVLGLGVMASASPITVTLGSNLSDFGGPASSGVYYYPYVLNVNGVNMNVACDDYFDDVYKGESWKANVTTVADLVGTKFGTADTTQYQEAAWLFTKFASPLLPNNSVNEAINYAMWDLFEGTAPGVNTGNPTSDTSSTYWINRAASADLSGLNFSDFVIYTPVAGTQPNGDGLPQEYIGEVPEPGTIFLMLTGLVGLAFLAWKRFPDECGVSAGSDATV
ncbi:MAG TPA: PEP-CTERM sorting domain-containing protein [Terriglobales bacterium]|nr:PEP-CTERM sorting domain-containing protein [Terriglobales bacterium]